MNLNNADRAKYRRQEGYPTAEGYTAEYCKALTDWKTSFGLAWQSRNLRFKGCNGKAVFNPFTKTAYSYGNWCFVTVIKGKVVFNEYRYSKTTSTHQSAVKSLLRQLGIKIDVYVDMAPSLTAFNLKREALSRLYDRLYTAEIAQSRPGAKSRADTLRALKRQIAQVRAIGGTFSRAAQTMLRNELLAREAVRLSDMAAASKARRALNKATAAMVQLNQVADLSQLSA